jgi:hypothetical protein
LLSDSDKGAGPNVFSAVAQGIFKSTKLFERRFQVLGNHVGCAAFYMVALNHVHQFAVFKESNTGR